VVRSEVVTQMGSSEFIYPNSQLRAVDSSKEELMSRSKQDVPRKRKPAVSKQVRALKPRASKPGAKTAGRSRAEGIRLFALAGRPSQQDFVKVYGPNGPKLTWAQRSEAGVPAEKFQAALAAKQSGR
jgi:hypothetical protein